MKPYQAPALETLSLKATAEINIDLFGSGSAGGTGASGGADINIDLGLGS